MEILQPDWVRRVNYLGAMVGGSRRLVRLGADELIEEARESTGLADFGEPGWEDAFRVLVDSLQSEVDLHTIGRLMTRAELLRGLRNRLLVTEACRVQPKIRHEQVVAPLLIAGQGRTGTSILFELLALDTNNRAPLAWEAASPAAPPGATLAEGVTREQIAETVNEFLSDVQPAIRAAHEHRWDLPVECIRFMDAEFSSDWWAMLYAAWTWLRWRAGHPTDAPYRWHRRVLQLLQYGHGDARRWLLKSPAHLGNLDRLLRQYPDIRIGPGYTWERGLIKLPLSLGLTLPPLDLNRSAIEVAQHARDAAAASLEDTYARLGSNREQMHTAMQQARLALGAIRNRELPAMQRIAQRATTQFEAGEIDRAQWAGAQIEELSMQLTEIDGIQRLRDAETALENALHRAIEGPETEIAAP